MELAELQLLISTPDELYKKVINERTSIPFSEFKKQYDPKLHDVKDSSKRIDKLINKPTGQKDAQGNDVTGAELVKVNRIPIPIQKKIVALSASFLCGIPIQLECNPKTEDDKRIYEALKLVWDLCKIQYENMEIAKILFSETEVAELWYTEPADANYWNGTVNQGRKFRLRMRLLCNSKGDELYPVFNNNGDMIAFGRGYKVKVDNNQVQHFELYTDTKIYKGKAESSNSFQFEEEVNNVGKIPVVYYTQTSPDWYDVQEMIDRMEYLASNHGDTNDYFASPMVKVKGTVLGFASKGESGKVLELENGADAEYMSWDQSPKSLELEFNNLRKWIYELTSTPDISFESMKGLGTFSGIALRMLFMDAHLKASDKEQNVGKGFQRRINFLKAALSKINVELEKGVSLMVKPKFEYFIPKNVEEMINLLNVATGSKPVISQKTAVALNPLVKDNDAEIKQIKEEQSSEGALNEQFN